MVDEAQRQWSDIIPKWDRLLVTCMSHDFVWLMIILVIVLRRSASYGGWDFPQG